MLPDMTSGSTTTRAKRLRVLLMATRVPPVPAMAIARELDLSHPVVNRVLRESLTRLAQHAISGGAKLSDFV